ncbi:hypothetical protein AD01_1597 [Escherichia coli 2-427-07_S4_C2]|nr:hypothetical protein AE10_02782 [Escherichia coli UCI 51]KDY46283.1 hypothetical protein AD01_1597 [Escherichia coli 2-427-07_S4_C2]KEJ39398.1 hypothetical protein AB65_3297 [Escherichia coli 2-460-02_S1_C3]KEO38584.1 hypothetical protein AB34_3099 [Escherichia coli 2-460-02_S1_C2]CAF2923874.1 hypothetical protein AI2959V1_1802 [Escherichia coli]
MESNIKGLVAAGHEMASELKAECGAVDMRSVAKSLERDAEYTMRKGLLIYKIWNESLTRGPDFVMLRSGEFSKLPVRVSFCPFCGESLKTWENRNE